MLTPLPVYLIEERVCVSEQQGRLYVNKVFNISAEKMFELLFTDSHFIRRFMNARKITSESSPHPLNTPCYVTVLNTPCYVTVL